MLLSDGCWTVGAGYLEERRERLCGGGRSRPRKRPADLYISGMVVERSRFHTSRASSWLFIVVRLRESWSAASPSERMLALLAPCVAMTRDSLVVNYLGCILQTGSNVLEIARCH